MIVTDLIMPDIGGRALLTRAREIVPGMPVLFISGYPDRATDPSAPIPAESAYLQKPFGPTDLTKRVREILDGSLTG